jgi:hypothetical protein
MKKKEAVNLLRQPLFVYEPHQVKRCYNIDHVINNSEKLLERFDN